jgi:hypothetical protein
MIGLEPHTAVLAAISDSIDGFMPVGNPMNETLICTSQ